MKKSTAAKYSPRIGELLVEFLDWYYAREQLLEEGQEPWDLDEALEYFSEEKKLAPYELYQVALYLSKKGYPIKAEEFHPEALPPDEKEEVSLEGIAEKSVFDDYFSAIKGERYEEAHQIYQRMRPSEKQVIQDQSRRKKSMSNIKKIAQTPDAQSAIEKQIPVEPVAEGPQESEIAEAIQTILDQANDLDIPPQLSVPLAVSFDHFKAGQGNIATLNAALRKVLDFLKQQGTPAESVEDLLQKQGPVAKGMQRLLRIADIADEQGWFDIADGITKILKAAYDSELQRLYAQEQELTEELESLHSTPPQDVDRDRELKIMKALDDVQDRILFKTSGPTTKEMGLAKAKEGLDYIKKQRRVVLQDLDLAIKQDNAKMVSDLRDMMDVLENEERKIRSRYKKEELEAPSMPGVVEEAQELVSPTTLLGKFKKALMTDNFEEAGALIKQMSDEERAQAVELAEKYHTAASLKKLYQIGKVLFDQKRYSEANVIGKIVRAQMMALPDDMQGQVILVLVPGGEDLPQAFRGQEEISSKMEDMAKRLNPMVEEEEGGCMPVEMNCSMPPATIAKLLGVADALDAKGLTVEASKIDAWLQKVALIVKAVREATCPDCGAKFMYYIGKPERYCVNCRRQRSQIGPQPKKPVVVPPKERWTKGGEFLDKIIEAAEKEHGGKPTKVVEIADAIRRDSPGTSDEAAYRMAWETYCSYTNPGHEGCTEKGKSHRKSPKPYEKAAKSEYVSEEGHFKGKEGSGERWGITPLFRF